MRTATSQFGLAGFPRSALFVGPVRPFLAQADLAILRVDAKNLHLDLRAEFHLVVRVLDPARATFYAERGLNTVCPTKTAISVLIDTVRATTPAPAEAQA